jgi:hypothetical protein
LRTASIFYVFAVSVIGVQLLEILQNILVLSQIAAFWIDARYGA